MTPLKPRHAAVMLAAVAACAIGMFSGVAGANSRSTTTTTIAASTPYQTGRVNAGTPNSTIVIYGKDGQIISYGNSSIVYTSPYYEAVRLGLNKFTVKGVTTIMDQAQYIAVGHALFEQNCASCHGVDANGVTPDAVGGGYPALAGVVGPAAVDFWIESGRMPAANPKAVQANRMPARLDRQQALAIASWINSLTSATTLPYVPNPSVSSGDVSNGFALFALNCAACHTITGDGDALGYSTFSPALRHIPAYQVAEAIRTGPGNMPRFSGNLSDAQVRDIVAYVVHYTEHPTNPGGLGLGGLGPVAEGFVGLALGVGILALIGFWVGDRQ